METSNEMASNPKQRHGCVTAWLIFMIIANSLTAVLYLFAGNTIVQNMSGNISNTMLIVLAILGIANVVFSVMLLNWKKIGFWGFVITSIVVLIINLSIGLGIAQSVLGLLGIVILYAVLQIKRDDVKAWTNLE